MKNTTIILLCCILLLPILTQEVELQQKDEDEYDRHDTFPDGTIVHYHKDVEIKEYVGDDVIDDWNYYLKTK